MKRSTTAIVASLALLSGLLGASPAHAFGIYMDNCPVGGLPQTAKTDTIEIRSEVASGPAFVKAYSLPNYHSFDSEISAIVFDVLRETVRPEDGIALKSYTQSSREAGKEMSTLHLGLTVSLQEVTGSDGSPVTVAVVSSQTGRKYSCTAIPLDKATPASVMSLPRDKESFLNGYKALLRKQVKAQPANTLCPAADDSYSFCGGAAASPQASSPPSYLSAPPTVPSSVPASPPPARRNYK